MSNKTIDSYVEAVFPIQCQGWDTECERVLDKPIEARVKVYKKQGSNKLIGSVECQYLTGEFNDMCKAAHPDVSLELECAYCPYAFDVPSYLSEYELDKD